MLCCMVAERVEMSWDREKHKWLVRIEVGQEVVRRWCDQSREADEGALRAAAEQTVADEGYQFDSARLAIRR